MDDLTFTTPHLHLRLLERGDEALYRELYTSPRVMARIAAPLDPARALRAFEAVLESHRLEPSGHRVWAAVERHTGDAIGIGALLRDGAEAEMGLMLRPRAWNGGYSTEVMAALVALAFDRLGIARLVGICREGPNVRMSRRLLAPHGFVDAPPTRPGTVRWILDRSARDAPQRVGSDAAAG